MEAAVQSSHSQGAPNRIINIDEKLEDEHSKQQATRVRPLRGGGGAPKKSKWGSGQTGAVKIQRGMVTDRVSTQCPMRVQLDGREPDGCEARHHSLSV